MNIVTKIIAGVACGVTGALIAKHEKAIVAGVKEGIHNAGKRLRYEMASTPETKILAATGGWGVFVNNLAYDLEAKNDELIAFINEGNNYVDIRKDINIIRDKMVDASNKPTPLGIGFYLHTGKVEEFIKIGLGVDTTLTNSVENLFKPYSMENDLRRHPYAIMLVLDAIEKWLSNVKPVTEAEA